MAVGVGGILDDPGPMRRYDASAMLDAVATLPAQIADGWTRTRSLMLAEAHTTARAVALLGMGGSAIGGDLVRGIFADRLRVPLVVVRDYDLPAWVGRETLVIASSYSGATEETISALGTALERRCPVAIITTGGPMREVASRASLPLLTFPGGGQPRAAVGYSMTLLAGSLERAGLLQLGDDEVGDAVTAASSAVEHFGPDVPTERNPAKQLAWSLVDRLPVVEASGALAVVARRWKAQLNENGKTAAFSEELPEATHNAVVGYGRPETIRDHLYVVFLASPDQHARNALRASLSAQLLGMAQIAHQVVAIGGSSALAQAVSAIVMGDYVSTYLAFLYGDDPSPVEAIGYVKARMSASDDEDDE